MTAHRNRVVPPAPASPAFIARERSFAARNYDPLPVVLAHGEGAWITDVDGRRYLDLMSAYSAVSFGHAHPCIVDALVAQARELAVTSRAFFNDKLPLLLERVTKLTGLDRARSRRTAAPRPSRPRSRRRASGRTRSRACRRIARRSSSAATISTAARSPSSGFSSEAQYRDGFGPFPPGFVTIPLRRRRGAGRGDHARHRGVPGRADAGRRRHHRAAGRLSRRVRAHLPRATTCS